MTKTRIESRNSLETVILNIDRRHLNFNIRMMNPPLDLQQECHAMKISDP